MHAPKSSVYIGPFLYVTGLTPDNTPDVLRELCWAVSAQTPDKQGQAWLPKALPALASVVDESTRSALGLDGRVMEQARAQLFKSLRPVVRALEAVKGARPVVMFGVLPMAAASA